MYNNDRSRYALVWKSLYEDVSINYYKLKFDAPELLENIIGGNQPSNNPTMDRQDSEASNPYL